MKIYLGYSLFGLTSTLNRSSNVAFATNGGKYKIGGDFETPPYQIEILLIEADGIKIAL